VRRSSRRKSEVGGRRSAAQDREDQRPTTEDQGGSVVLISKGTLRMSAWLSLVLLTACFAGMKQGPFCESRPRPTPKLARTSPVPDAKTVAESYGPLKEEVIGGYQPGALHGLLVSGACQPRKWSFKGSNGLVEVSEDLYRGEPIFIQTRQVVAVDPIQDLEDEEVESAEWEYLGQAVRIDSKEGLRSLSVALRTKSSVVSQANAFRPCFAKGAVQTDWAFPAITGGVEGRVGGCLTLHTKPGLVKKWVGHLEEGEFEDFQNPSLHAIFDSYGTTHGTPHATGSVLSSPPSAK